jgi:D-alanyl-D-alanine carboxypeptidase
MKKVLIYIPLLFLAHCSTYRAALPIESCNQPAAVKNKQQIEAALDELVGGGVPGVALAVYSEDGIWSMAKGLAKIETNTPMQICHLQYLQSISKTYMAVAVLKLYEEGKIKLDASLVDYLPAMYSDHITRAKEITVRMLLNHTSGIPEYNFSPSYISELLQHPDQFFSPEDYLKYIDGKPLDFEPGSKYSYRNTNYLILALMVDAITDNHAKYISDVIFKPLGLTNTFYRTSENHLNYPLLVNAYWDRHSDGIIENVSLLQRTNVASLIGDDGIVTTPEDAVRFLKGLMENELLNESTMNEMRTFVRDTKGNERYGLGLARAFMVGQTGYGHSGGGIGAGCELYYFPDKKKYVFVAINLGTVTESPLHENVVKSKDKMYEAIFSLN